MSREHPSLLVVDDEVDSCRNLSDIFTDMGYRVDMAFDGPGALEKLQHARYDIALLDLMMPGMDGMALYHEIKRLHPETVAILATAYPSHPRAEAGVHEGIWRVLPKPVDLARLFALIDEAVDKPVVLVVDDDHDLCANMWDLLHERGFRVGLAHDVQTAGALLKENGYSVVLIDMRLPDGDGTDVFRLARNLESGARTVMITGWQSELGPSLEQLKTEGVDAVCFKPFDMDELLNTVERLGRSQLPDQKSRT